MTVSTPAITVARAGRREWSALVVLMLPVLLISIDNTVLNFAIPAISESLEPDSISLLWIIDAYPLVLTGLLVAFGSLADRIGRRRLLLVGATGFAVVSVLAAFAPSAGALIAARVGLGVFGATLMPSTLSLLRGIFVARDQRRLAIAVLGTGFAVGAALGPLVGGLLLETGWWGSIFLLAVPVLVPLLVFAPILVDESKDPEPGPIDLVSIALSFAALGPFVYGIKALATHGLDPVAIVAVLVGVVAGVLFVRRQLARAVPMLDVRLFRRGTFSGAVIANLMSITAFMGMLFFATQDLQLVIGMSPIEAAIVLLPGLVASLVAGLVVVPVARRVRPGIVIPVAFAASLLGYLAIALAGTEVNEPVYLLAFIGIGIGVGGGETVTNELIIATAPPAKAGAASAVSETAYELGAVLGTAVLGLLATVFYRAALVLPEGVSAAQGRVARGTIGGAEAVSRHLDPARADALMQSAREAFVSGTWLVAGLAALLLLIGLVAAAVSLRRIDPTTLS